MSSTTNPIIEQYRQIWNDIHTKAAAVVLEKKPEVQQKLRTEYVSFIRDLPNKIYCHVCKNHLTQYLQTNPPEHATNLFVWSWDFHNTVNVRLGKSKVDYATAALRYLGSSN